MLCSGVVIPEHNNSRSHKHKEKFNVVVKGYEFIRPDINKIDSIYDICARDYYKKYFHTFKLRCIYDIEMTNVDFANGTIFDGKLKNCS